MDRFLYRFFLSVFLLLIFVTPFSSVNAQEMSQRWVCLKADQAEGHSATVSVDPEAKLLPNSDTYIFECFAKTCTSGDSELDKTVFQKDNLQKLTDQYGYLFEGQIPPQNPIMSDGEGNIPPFTWQSSTPESHARRWMALNYFEPTPDLGTGGEEKTQQVGTFSFEAVANKSNCVTLAWDPYGRVFDSQTLEPVSNASVTLFKKGSSGFEKVTRANVPGGNIKNPQRTEEDGGFSFTVPDGTYKLTVSHSNYDFPEVIGSLQPNYLKIYSDIYPGQTGVEIVQQGAIQHRDVPLKQVSAGLETVAKVMEDFQDLDKVTSTVTVAGRVSHPFAKIMVYSLHQENVRFRLLKTVIADKLGNFTFSVNQSEFIEITEFFGEYSVVKTDLTQPNLVTRIKQWLSGLIGRVSAQTTIASSVRLEPILNYLEGYAYDAQGKIIPNATVGVVLNFSNKPSYQVKADENGYFKMASEFLPSMPYRITYTTLAGQVVETSTSKFIAQNKDFIAASDIKINQFVDKEGKVVPPPEKASGIANGEGSGQNLPANESSKSLSTVLPLILTIMVLFVLLAIVAAVIFMKKKNTIL